MTKNGKKGYVYLLADFSNEGIYKIGVTRGDIERRIKELQTGNSGEIYTFAFHESDFPFFIEKQLHNKYSNKNILNEWYELTLEEALQFRDNCIKEEKMIEVLKDNPFFAKELKLT